jgi:LysM repeat protein
MVGMRRAICICFLLNSFVVYSFAQSKKRISVSDYINTYKDAAISEMKRSGIPASITLAQGMLESDNGNSRLTREGNNHFGIKCHDWSGQGIYQDDDSKNECFRKYKTADESFRDHSDFLLSRQRYSPLFEYKTTDYKSWAKGLKRVGYATNSKYDDLLIRIIEENQLHQYDQDFVSNKHNRNVQTTKKNLETNEGDFTISLTRPIFKRNDIEYVVVRNGDSFDKLSRELEMLTWELFKYNELTKDSALHEGQILYLQPKHRRAERGKESYTVLPGETVYSISQLFGVKSRLIRRFNHLSENEEVKTGDVLNLRSRK